MRGIKFWVFFSTICLIFSAASAREPVSQAQEMEISQAADSSYALNNLDTQWLWGEVSYLDIPNNKITINYFDYETDSEKSEKVSVDGNTKYENIKSLNEIKLNDAISIDYTISPDGRHIAKNIRIERPEEVSALAVSASVPVTTP